MEFTILDIDGLQQKALLPQGQPCEIESGSLHPHGGIGLVRHLKLFHMKPSREGVEVDIADLNAAGAHRREPLLEPVADAIGKARKTGNDKDGDHQQRNHPAARQQSAAYTRTFSLIRTGGLFLCHTDTSCFRRRSSGHAPSGYAGSDVGPGERAAPANASVSVPFSI